ncbi:hypothetical protein [Mangrovitalea sediminis]|uniref:hypothetical protein n=1 Tax=Mangrovitalea sediminis TaxID=1982043 RepID=UPI000BE4CE0D|nr:hypothetical protein [Mangrovitalea sediminis]
MNRSQRWWGCRYDDTQSQGHYESFFLRANDPLAARAVWLRYTLFRPRGVGQTTIAELWAMVFLPGKPVIALRESWPLSDCRFSPATVDVGLPQAALTDHSAAGRLGSLAWDLSWQPRDDSLLLLPEHFYGGSFPKAKSLVLQPGIRVDGTLSLDGDSLTLAQWPGSLNHNWGSRHTDAYAWGQIAAFDNDPQAFLECATARVAIGPFLSPAMTLMVLRSGTRAWTFNSLSTAFRAKARYQPFTWEWETGDRQTRIHARFTGQEADFAALRYGNPPGGDKFCLNSKVARCEVDIRERGQPTRRLLSEHGGAFEILTDRLPHGMTPANSPVNPR